MKKYESRGYEDGYCEFLENNKFIICRTKSYKGKIRSEQARSKLTNRIFKKINKKWIDESYIVCGNVKIYKQVCF